MSNAPEEFIQNASSIDVIESIACVLVGILCVILYHYFSTRSKRVIHPKAPTLPYIDRVTPEICHFVPVKDLAKLIAEYSSQYDIIWEPIVREPQVTDVKPGRLVSRQTIGEVSRFPWAIDVYLGSTRVTSDIHINPSGLPVGVQIVNSRSGGCVWLLNRGERSNLCYFEPDSAHVDPMIVRIEFHATVVIVVTSYDRHELPLNGESFQDRTLQLWPKFRVRQNISAPYAIPFDRRL